MRDMRPYDEILMGVRMFLQAHGSGVQDESADAEPNAPDDETQTAFLMSYVPR